MTSRRAADGDLLLRAMIPGERYHGLELSKLTGLRSGRLYPALTLLTEAGALVPGWDEEPIRGPGEARRRHYVRAVGPVTT